jgi:hypothetical protein
MRRKTAVGMLVIAQTTSALAATTDRNLSRKRNESNGATARVASDRIDQAPSPAPDY